MSDVLMAFHGRLSTASLMHPAGSDIHALAAGCRFRASIPHPPALSSFRNFLVFRAFRAQQGGSENGHDAIASAVPLVGALAGRLSMIQRCLLHRS